MTTEEVINELNSLVKPYFTAKIPQSTYSRTLRDIKNGNCKPKTMSKFFAKFGYEQNQVTWKRKNISVNVGFTADDIDSNLTTIRIDYSKP